MVVHNVLAALLIRKAVIHKIAPAMVAGAVGLLGVVVPSPVAAVRKRERGPVTIQAQLMVVRNALAVVHKLNIVIRKVAIWLVADTLRPNVATYII